MKLVALKLFVILLLTISLKGTAQSYSLMGKKWIIAESGISDNLNYGIIPQLKPLVVFFNKDSANNQVDYSKIEMRFFSGGNYEAKNDKGATYNGSWNMNAAGDSLTTDSITYRFDFINEYNCITNNASVQVIDTIGTLDTLYSYIKLYGVPDITSVDENAASTIRLYPLPAKEYIHVEFSSKNYREARLYNIFGQLLRTIPIQGKEQLTLNLQTLANGYYSLEIISDDGSRIVKKVVKE